MNNPKISVIIPVYNVEKYLGECLESIINQTLRDIEVICVNDASTDSSLSILKEYASKDERIKIIDKENEGSGYARKCGLDIATGKYILFCDSDDYYVSNDVFEKIYNEIEKNDSELMIFRFWFGNKKAKNLENYNTIDDIDPSILIFNLYFAPWFKIYKKSFLDRYDTWCFPKYLKFEDVPFHIQSCLRAKSISFSKVICYYYRCDNIENVTNSKKGRKHVENICEIVLLVYDILKKENCLDKYNLEFTYLSLVFIRAYFIETNYRVDLISIIKNTFDKLNFNIKKIDYPFPKNINFPYLNREYIIFYKIFVRFDIEVLCTYIENKKKKFENKLHNHISNLEKNIKEINRILLFRDNEIKNLDNILRDRDNIIKNLDNTLRDRDNTIKNLDNTLRDRDNTIKNLDNALKSRDNTIKQGNDKINIQGQAIKRLQNSWSYRIGRLFTYPFSIPLEFYKFIRDYNLIKKSGLFDSEYYLLQNEDVKRVKMNPIKHYLQFGWREGRNPSVEFDGNEYLNKRPDVQVAGICPLVHYIKFGKEEI